MDSPPGSPWLLRYEGFDPAAEALRESLCALGNGRFATRAAAPESRADGTHYPGTYAAGVVDRLSDDVSGRTVENESIVNLPDWQSLTLRIGDGDWLDLTALTVSGYVQELDLRRGVSSPAASSSRTRRDAGRGSRSGGWCRWPTRSSQLWSAPRWRRTGPAG
jgi:trehalose/maltose hydrolase-like predicted phosphorylase